MKKLLALAAAFVLTFSTANADILKTHYLSNEVSLALGDSSGDFCSATVIDKTLNLAVSANHCAERVHKRVCKCNIDSSG